MTRPTDDDTASQLGSSMGFSPDGFDFTSEPMAAKPAETLLPMESLRVDPTNPNAEVNHSEFSIVKLSDVATPKAHMDDDLLLPAVQMDDAFDFTTKPAGPEPYMEWKLKEVMISGYQMSHDDGDGGSIDGLAVDPNNPNAEVNHSEFSVVKLLDATTPKVHMDDGLLLPAVQTDDAVTWTAIAMAESGGNTGAHNPRGEDSRGLWQINVDPAQTNNPDTFDCSELVQLASEPAELPGQSTVATETLTIVHEGFLV